MKRIYLLLIGFGQLLSFIYPERLNRYIYSIWAKIYTGYKSQGFKSFGCSNIEPDVLELIGKKYIKIGDGSSFGKGLTLTAFDFFKGQYFSPSIIIGNNVSIGAFSHITAIDSIIIKDGTLTGKFVTITDNSHGLADMSDFDVAPTFRDLTSKGPVIIEENVWIGEKASIMPGVIIGRGSIVAANAVVTKNVPPYSLVAGVPAKIIKQVNHNNHE